MTRDLRDAAADLLHAASERIHRQGHHQGPGPAARELFMPTRRALEHRPITVRAALLVEAHQDPYEPGEHPAAVHLAVQLWAEHLAARGEQRIDDSDGYFDAPATADVYEQAPGRTANQIAETLRVAAALELASLIGTRT